MRNFILIATVFLGLKVSNAQDPISAPEFEQYPFLLDSGIPKLDIDFALNLKDLEGF